VKVDDNKYAWNAWRVLCIVQLSEGHWLSDVKRRIGLASSVMASLSTIQRDQCLSLTINIRTYKALVLSTLLYAAETWTMHAEDARIRQMAGSCL